MDVHDMTTYLENTVQTLPKCCRYKWYNTPANQKS